MINLDLETNTSLGDILIIDDKLENIKFLSDFLSKQNYQVRKAINGQAALTAAKFLPPDLILLDINMPGMGGYEVCENLKNDPTTSSIPVIFLSAGNEISDKIRAFKVGGVDYITKPFQLEEILVRVQTQLTLQRLQKELQSRNKQLQNMLGALQNTQAELIQKETLINAGRITAGISHEINNPLSFIFCNLEPATDYSQKLINLIQLYQQAFPNATPEISNFIEEIELDFLVSDFTKIIHSISTGAERIRSVVRALHIFSRLDESGIKPINVSECIESVLTIIRHQLVLNHGSIQIKIVKRYEELPTFLGYANLFNQAVLNILQNAIDALESRVKSDSDSSFEPTIWIQVYSLENAKIIVSIKDNGEGVLVKNQAHLFEPFFTTKLIGKGVGLGLFTSHQIITELHKGNLTYHACDHGGSEFIIEIPTS
jgi:signal transduction histidine kinase